MTLCHHPVGSTEEPGPVPSATGAVTVAGSNRPTPGVSELHAVQGLTLGLPRSMTGAITHSRSG
jgi:hypothetical protein